MNFIVVEGGPYHGREVPIDDLRLFLHGPETYGYIVTVPVHGRATIEYDDMLRRAQETGDMTWLKW